MTCRRRESDARLVPAALSRAPRPFTDVFVIMSGIYCKGKTLCISHNGIHPPNDIVIAVSKIPVFCNVNRLP
jgi:hypothetical protein